MKLSTAALVRGRVLHSQDRYWRVEDFDTQPHAVVTELRRLANAGHLERVRRGVYWRGRQTRFGPRAPTPLEALRKVVGAGEAIGAAGWYASNLLGLSTQVAPQPVVALTGRPPTGLRGMRVVSRASRTGRRDARLNDVEVTVLEALQGWEKYVELDHSSAREHFVALLRRPEVRVDRIVRASATEPAIVRERLRAVLEAAGQTSAARRVARARSASSKERALRVLRGAS